LYAMKRSAESADLGLTFNEQDKAHKQLAFAANRLEEVAGLVAAASTRPDAALVAGALRDFDSAARTGSHLTLARVAETDSAKLASLRQWADYQTARLGSLIPTLPPTTQSS